MIKGIRCPRCQGIGVIPTPKNTNWQSPWTDKRGKIHRLRENKWETLCKQWVGGHRIDPSKEEVNCKNCLKVMEKEGIDING